MLSATDGAVPVALVLPAGCSATVAFGAFFKSGDCTLRFAATLITFVFFALVFFVFVFCAGVLIVAGAWLPVCA